MKRLIALIVLLVFGSVAYADYEMSDSQKQGYVDWLKTFGAWDAVSSFVCYHYRSWFV